MILLVKFEKPCKNYFHEHIYVIYSFLPLVIEVYSYIFYIWKGIKGLEMI